MHMVPHDDIGVEIVMLKRVLSIVDCIDDHARDLRLAKVQRAGTGVGENAIHGEEGLSGGSRHREVAACREAIVQAPSEEHRLANGVIMRQTASVKGHHNTEWMTETKFSGRLTIGRRLTTCPTASCVIF